MKKQIIIGMVCFILGLIFCGIVNAAVSLSSDKVGYNNTTVDVALDNLFDESVNGKTKIAEAITNKGIETLNTDSYDTIVSNINNISTGITDADKKLYDSLKYSGLVTEDMTFDEMCNALSNRYPEKKCIVGCDTYPSYTKISTSAGTQTVTESDKSIILNVKGVQNRTDGVAIQSELIDFTDYTKLTISVSVSLSSSMSYNPGYGFAIADGIYDSNENAPRFYYNNAVATKDATSGQIIIDVSEITGYKRLCFWVATVHATESSLFIHHIELSI